MVDLSQGRKVSLQEAQRLFKSGGDFAMIVWRPEENLPEEEQYAVIID